MTLGSLLPPPAAPHGCPTKAKIPMIDCRCEVLNVMSGAVARDYVRVHLQQSRTDGMGRPVQRCDQTGIEWVEERSGAGYGDDVMLLRRLSP